MSKIFFHENELKYKVLTVEHDKIGPVRINKG